MKSTKDRIVTVYCPFSALKAIAEKLTKATLDAETRAKQYVHSMHRIRNTLTLSAMHRNTNATLRNTSTRKD